MNTWAVRAFARAAASTHSDGQIESRKTAAAVAAETTRVRIIARRATGDVGCHVDDPA
jgi:hypothetical protein